MSNADFCENGRILFRIKASPKTLLVEREIRQIHYGFISSRELKRHRIYLTLIWREFFMNFRRTAGLIATAILVSGIFVTASIAQPGHARWEGNNGRHLGWYKGRHRGWDRDRGWRDRRAVYYRPVRYRTYNYYPGYGYGGYSNGIGSSILSSIGLGNLGYYNSGYRRYYRSDHDRRKWLKKYYKHQRHWHDDD
jgi:hypothetical protein